MIENSISRQFHSIVHIIVIWPPLVINQEADRGVYIQEQVEPVKHSTVSQLIDLSLYDICVLGNLFIFCDLIVHDCT